VLRKRNARLWIGLALFVATAIGLTLWLRPPQFHPHLVIQAGEKLQLTFLQQGEPSRARCEITVDRMVKAMLAKCPACRVVENRCLEKLDPLQRKILHGQPVNVPVMRMPGGAVAFISNAPELALQVCQEAERQSAGNLPGAAQCKSASNESLALSIAAVASKIDGAAIPRHGLLPAIVLMAAIISFIFCFLIVRFDRLHSRFSHDKTGIGPQKFHAVPTARIGGVAIAAALGISVPVIDALGWLRPAAADGLAMLSLAAIPAFAGGFAEDVTKRFGVLARLMLTIAAGVIASLLVGATLDRLDVPGFDALLQWPIFAIAFTAFAVGGVANAINIIDGYNGLVGGYAIIVLAALGWVSAQVGDQVVLTASLIMLGALLGFLVWNFPGGRIFLGDGGAYLLGFWLAELSVLIVVRNPEVSPWFPLLLLAYPVFETIFSIYRRKFLHGENPGHPDALHLHQLIYRSLARTPVLRDRDAINRHHRAVAWRIWAGSAAFIAPALIFWSSTQALVIFAITFCAGYVSLYFLLLQSYVRALPSSPEKLS
jgi:UDP-GlcNAc:undecaprenyl-phosphate/decaprenyl-phosphate GlcNAc-1-phosphate transferase